ncbi:MAG TPA: oligosaccharide flippase family protein [Armatimonadota bacterium]|nr:oligosaccharide flippase family protein [Armatimonadota bacterium]
MAVGDSGGGLSLRCNFSWTVLGNIFYAGCQWGMMVVLAKLGSPEKVGRFALGFAVTAPVVMFANLHLRAVLATDAKKSHPFGDYLALRSATSGLAILVILGIAFMSKYAFETAMVILAIGAAKTLEAQSDIYYGLLQHHERMDRIAKSGVIKGSLSLAALAAAFYVTRSVLWASVVLMVVWGLVLIFYDARSTKLVVKLIPDTVQADLCPRWKLSPMFNLAGIALPLGIVMLFISLNVNIPRYFIERYLGENNLGIFAAMTYPMAAGTLLVSALAQSAIPRLAKHYAAGDVAAFRTLLAKLVAFGLAIGAAAIITVAAAGRWALNLFYGPEYAAHSHIFLWISVAAAVYFVQWFLGDGLTAARYFKVQAPLLGIVTLVTVLASLWLIPAHGLMGAAFVLLIGNSVLALGILIVDIYAIAALQRRKA